MRTSRGWPRTTRSCHSALLSEDRCRITTGIRLNGGDALIGFEIGLGIGDAGNRGVPLRCPAQRAPQRAWTTAGQART